MTREMPQFNTVEKKPPIAIGAGEHLLDFIEREYFQNFLDELDMIESENVGKGELERVDIDAVGKFLGIDIAKMRNYMDEKIPELVEKIHLMIKEKNLMVVSDNSMIDVLGNSIITIFNRIVWVLENYHNPDPVVQEKISNPNSNTRKIINLYVKNEVQSGLASYYINTLCADEEKLKIEISTRDGFLKGYQEYFREIAMNGQMTIYFPRGGKKLAYFKFFNELESGNINNANVEIEMSDLDEKIVDKEKIRRSDLVKKAD